MTVKAAEAITQLWERTKSRTDSLRDRLREVETRSLLQADLIAELQAELAQLREGGALNLANAHKGTYQRGVEYRRGELVTSGGGVWLALQSTVERPGSSDSWRLVVKS